MISVDERFDQYVIHDESGCWLWTGAVRGDGYGAFQIGLHLDGPDWYPASKQVGAHRFAFARAAGRWPSGQVLHHCDTPLCVRPDHLYEGTHADNMRDTVERGQRPRLENHGRARLTVEDVRAVRAGEITATALAKLRGVTVGAVCHAKSGRNWRGLDG